MTTMAIRADDLCMDIAYTCMTTSGILLVKHCEGKGRDSSCTYQEKFHL
jgi:hypothetical protein